MESLFQLIFAGDFFYSTIRLATPLLLAALGGLFSERAGVLSLGMEGMMLGGTLLGFLGSYFTGSPWLGIFIAALGGLVVALLYALVTVTFRADQVVASVGINIIMMGLTGVIYRGIFGTTLSQQIVAPALKPLAIPGLAQIPFLGPVLFDHLAMVYVAFLLVPITYHVLYHTTWGLKIRAVGEYPLAADTLGVNVFLTRYLAILVSGFLASAAGALLSIGYLNMFMENMTAGRGFIAFSAIIFGKWTPLGTMAACLVFGAADALQLRIQAFGLGLPYQLAVMFPYAITLLALLFVGRSQGPAAAAIPYSKD
ncbi:MAG: ABC transporter permease [Firmicutes bacterium]|nr:ABC transporter permease [Bacillota bacterium]MCL5039234.1 ABC transporter permease [Bacillota bacterium]